MTLVSSFCRNKREDGPTPCYYPDCHCSAHPPDDYVPGPARDFNKVEIDDDGYFTFPKDKEYKKLTFEPSKLHYNTITYPKYSDWKCTIAGGLTFVALEGQAPNRFHRFMQSIILGFNWKKD